MTNAAHCHNEELEDYFMDLLPSGDQSEIETHLASCDQCAAMARSLHHSWVRLEAEMTPEAYGAAFRESARQGLLVGLQSLAFSIEKQATAWLDEIKRRTAKLSWVVLDAPSGLRQARVLGTSKQTSHGPETRTTPVVVMGREGFPRPEVHIENGELVVEFREIGIFENPPAVFLISTVAPDQTIPLKLSWSQSERAWGWRGPALLDDLVLAIGFPLTQL